MSAPHYYSSLAPFREKFLTGQPVLTYHHVGPRRRGVRIKGLYVSAKLFARQLAELKVAGFSTPPVVSVLEPKIAVRKNIFLTFDDGFHDVFENAAEPLVRCGFTGIQFLVADLIGKTNEWQQRDGDVVEPLMDAAQIRDWLAAGHEIGAHSCTHPFLSRISRDHAREEIETSKRKLEDLFGRAIEHFCYPYGDWNNAVRELVIAAGYKTAFTTATGVNLSGESPFALKRFTARYPSRNLKALWLRLTGRLGAG